MVKRRFKEPEIKKILKEYINGRSIQQILEEYGISQATFYNWKTKYSPSPAINTEELIKLKEDNDRLKRMFADIVLENVSLKAQLKKYSDANM